MKRFIIYMLSLCFAVACAKFDNETLSTSDSLGQEVAMTLSIGVNSITGEEEELPSITVRAEASDELIDDISSAVMNLWVLQFDGTSDDSKIISMSYIEDGESTLVGQSPKINFVATPAPTTIIFLANTFDTALIPSLSCTLADVKALNYPVVTNLEDPEDLNSAQLSYANGLATEDADGKKYFTMSSSMDLQISESEAESTELSIKLLRNAVKLTFVLNNEWSESELVSISLRDASEKAYYYSSYLTDNSDGSYLATNSSFPQNTNPVDYQTTPLSLTSEMSQTITFYAPANLKGIIPISTQESKSYYAPSTSTYIYIEALYNETKRYYYTYYLGGDLEMNYNLLPNHAYTYTLNFNEGGSANTDYSVNANEIDYTLREASNCYILNPSSSEDVVYYIPIQSRINEFWGEYATNYPKSDRLNSDTDWDYAVLWYDNDDSPICPAEWAGDIDISIPSTKQVKIERIESYNGLPALKVTLPQLFDNDGNMVVAVFDREGTLTEDGYHATPAIEGDILWSWHFWITDYNPDSRSHSPVSGEYRYSVDGGEIHRYIDNVDEGYDDATKLTHATNHTYYTKLWDGGAYSNSFIMDRNLGARGSSYTEQGAGPIGSVLGTSRYYIPGALYFQAGRKDPFIGNIGMFLTGKDEDDNYIYEHLDINDSSSAYRRREQQNVGTQKDDSQCDYSFEDAVLRPTVYFYSSNSMANWTSEPTANSLDFLWSDKTLNNTTEAYYDITEKSIFDPSPLGWRIPIRGTWDNFNCDPTSGNPASAYATYIPITGSNESREYALCGAIYPGASGIMVGGNFFKTSYLETLSWTATPYNRAAELESTSASSFYSSYLGAYADGIFPQGASWHYRQIGMPVRPVKCQ